MKRLLRQGRVDALILLNLDDTIDLDPESMDHLPIVLVDREAGGLDKIRSQLPAGTPVEAIFSKTELERLKKPR